MTRRNCVFLVDDDPSARRGLARLLRAAGHDTRDCGSAAELLDIVEPDASGCLVLDAQLPDLDGKKLKAELDARGIELAIIVVTVDDGPETRRNAHNLKAASLFRKPVDGAALLDAVDWAIES